MQTIEVKVGINTKQCYNSYTSTRPIAKLPTATQKNPLKPKQDQRSFMWQTNDLIETPSPTY